MKIPNNYSSPRISNEYKDCALPLTFDSLSFCAFGCLYCFAYYQKSNNPAYKTSSLCLKSINLEKLSKTIRGYYPNNPYYKRFFKHKFPLHWGGLADPFDINETKSEIGLKLIKLLADLNYPTIFSTKGTLPTTDERYLKVFQQAKRDNFIFQFSIVTNSNLASKEFEPLAPTTSERLACMKVLSELGYYTILRLRPYIIGLTDINIEDLIRRASEAGCKSISTEFLCIDVRMNKGMARRYEKMSKLLGFDLLKYYKTLSPTERGTYLRLNRKVKAEHIEKLLILCKKYNLAFNISDPDFKELNFSSCCCGIPDTNTKFNFSRAQLTHLLVVARKKYREDPSQPSLISFSDLLLEDTTEWLEETDYYSDSLKLWNSDYSCKGKNFKRELREIWNNLASPENPYNYFHGVLKPIKLDEDNNIIFQYQPTIYEEKWSKLGLLK